MTTTAGGNWTPPCTDVFVFYFAETRLRPSNFTRISSRVHRVWRYQYWLRNATSHVIFTEVFCFSPYARVTPIRIYASVVFVRACARDAFSCVLQYPFADIDPPEMSVMRQERETVATYPTDTVFSRYSDPTKSFTTHPIVVGFLLLLTLFFCR